MRRAMMRFSDWLESLVAASYHEAGHVVAMQERAPDWFVSACIFQVPAGWSGEVNVDKDVEMPDQETVRYIAGMGCLSEAKRASSEDMSDADIQKLAVRIIQQVNADIPSFWIADPDDADPATALPKATCSRADYDLLDKPLNLVLIRDSLTECRDFLAAPDNWKRVVKLAKFLGQAPYRLDELPE
jgi:hypothetical protein